MWTWTCMLHPYACLLVVRTQADLERAFAYLDRDHAGSLDVDQFKQILLVAGERLPAQVGSQTPTIM